MNFVGDEKIMAYEYQPLVDPFNPKIRNNTRTKMLAALIALVLSCSFMAYMVWPTLKTNYVAQHGLLYNEFRLPTDVHPTHYNIGLDITMPTKSDNSSVVKGFVIMDIEVTSATDKIVFHTVDQELENVALVQKEKNYKIAKSNYNKEMEYQVLIFDKKLEKGSYSLSMGFKYDTRYDLRGFYLSSYKTSEFSEDYWIGVTQFEATDARRAFPNFDEPDKKATYDITLHVPKEYHALSNMPISRKVDHGESTIYEFQTTPKMSSYLLAFAVSQFEPTEVVKTVNNVEVRCWTRQGMTDQGVYAAAAAVKVLEKYTELFDIEYPLPKLDMIAIPSFSAGAMENWGFVTYRDTAILIDPKISSEGNYQRVATVVAHELAHQW
eukprot:NODE_214_length_12495_cov_0.543078.p3 type:complete len:380 gc:universal NODE_214_length_12495_cov_0.543078:10334-11473(+)